jgi:hypothetical protein
MTPSYTTAARTKPPMIEITGRLRYMRRRVFLFEMTLEATDL